MPWICAPFWAPAMVTGPVAAASVPLPTLPSWRVSTSLRVSEDDPEGSPGVGCPDPRL